MTRWKASATHFLISLVVLGIVTALVVWRWYPPGLFGMAKAGMLLAILAGVDLVLGPLLTAIVFRSGKPGLKFDLTVIALLQVAALAYGFHTLWTSRPAYIVAVANQFRLVFANELEIPSTDSASSTPHPIPRWGAEVVAAPLPTDPKARMAAIMDSLGGADAFLEPSHYVPYPPPGDEPLRFAMPAAKVIALAPASDRAAWRSAFDRHAGVARLSMLPLQSMRGSAAVLLDGADGRIVGYVGLDPWPIMSAAERERSPAAP